jgi:CHAD domain-containing protein
VGSERYTALVLALGERFAYDELAGVVRPPPAAGTAAAPKIDLAVPVEDFAVVALDRLDRRLRKRGEGVPRATPEARHQVRIAAKKLRYATEFFAPLFPKKRVAPYLAALESLQDILGALNDAIVADGLLAEAAAARATPIPARVDGLVRGWTAANAAGGLGRYARAWRDFAGAKPFWR